MKAFKSLFITIGICSMILGVALMNQPQQCIDSSVVEKFDIIKYEDQKIENSTHRCGSKLKSKYSKNIDVYLGDLTQRLSQITTALKSTASFSQNIQVTIDEVNTLQFQVDGLKIIIGKDLYSARGHFERAVIKAWFRQQSFKNNMNSINYRLVEESYVDLMYYYIYGKFDLFDPTTQIQTKTGSAPWPQILKNLKSYCESSWKLSEDYSSCQLQKNSKIDLKSDQIINTSIRPLLTSALIEAFNQISFRKRNQFITNLTHQLTIAQLDAETKINQILKYENPLLEGLNSIKLFLSYFSDFQSSKAEIDTAFYFQMKNYMSQQGVSDSYSEAYFDYLFEVSGKLDEQSNLLMSLLKHSMNHLKLQIAIKDSEKIWILPSKTSLPLTVFNLIKAKQHVYFLSPEMKSIHMVDFIKNSEKLMMIKGLNLQKDYKFDILFDQSILDFIKTEKDIAFIQFHLPSLEMRLNEFKHISNYFELVQSRDISRYEFQQLGWQGLQWIDQYKYYKPKAVIDAIEYFRLEPNAKN